MIASLPAAPPAAPSWRRIATRRGRPWSRWLLALIVRHAASSQHTRTQRSGSGPDAPLGGNASDSGLRAQVDTLYQLHARAVLAYLCRRLSTLADAEDALSDVFLAALTSCVGGTTPSIGWLLVVARRRIADFYRERERHPISDLPLDTPTSADEPETLSLKDEEQRELLAMIARLPDEQQEVLALRFAAGLRSSEIAAVIGKSEDATRAVLSRAVRHLRKEWVR